MPRTDKKLKSQTKVTLYVDKDVLKEFKKLAIDKEQGFSALAQAAFEAYLKSHKESHSQRKS
jgi:post-segregation antitoxin (ccd killing protein)